MAKGSSMAMRAKTAVTGKMDPAREGTAAASFMTCANADDPGRQGNAVNSCALGYASEGASAPSSTRKSKKLKMRKRKSKAKRLMHGYLFSGVTARGVCAITPLLPPSPGSSYLLWWGASQDREKKVLSVSDSLETSGTPEGSYLGYQMVMHVRRGRSPRF